MITFNLQPSTFNLQPSTLITLAKRPRYANNLDNLISIKPDLTL
ncbi:MULTISPECIES: hypothetical protein [Moorena]|nr:MULTISPECIES: hypothetical protein [Moorena]